MDNSSQTAYSRQVLLSSWLAVFSLFGVRATFAVLKDPMAFALGWSQTQISFGYSLMMLSYAVTAFISGYMLDAFGPKIVYATAAVLGCIGLCLTAFFQGYVAYLVFFGIITGAATGMLWVSATVTVRKWFSPSSYARNWGLAFSGAPIAQFSLSYLMRLLLAQGSWNRAMMVLGGIIGTVLAAAWILSKHDPEKYGFKPAGETNAMPLEAVQWSVKKAFMTFPIWCVILLFLTSMMGEFLIWTQVVSFWTEDLFWSREKAVFTYSIIGAAGIISMPVLGRVSDLMVVRRGNELSARRMMLTAGPLLGILACVGLLASIKASWVSYGSAVIFSLYWAIVPGGVVGYAGAYYGRKSLGRIWGLATMIVMGIGPFLGTFIGALLRDVTGSYLWSVGFALFSFSLSVLWALLLPNTRKGDSASKETPIDDYAN